MSQFTITNENRKKKIAKPKRCTAPGTDGIQNLWREKFESVQKALGKTFTDLHVDTAMIFKWWLFRRTALLPNTKNLIGKKNYRPITCLNTSYKILTSLVEKYMREHTTVNKIWNERKLEAAEGVLSTVDQLIIDICITEEVKRESSQPGSSLLQLQKGI